MNATMNPESRGRADLHMHTSVSDGIASPAELLEYVAMCRTDLDVIAITDHDALDAALYALDQHDEYPFDVVPGVEVTSTEGHILALWVTTPIPRDLNFVETVQAIHEAGGVAVLAHPYHPLLIREYPQAFLRTLREPEALIGTAGFDAIEGINAGIIRTGANNAAYQLAQRFGLPVVGGSDAHTLGAIGSGITRFSGTTADDLRHALTTQQTSAQGQAWSINDYFDYFTSARPSTETASSA